MFRIILLTLLAVGMTPVGSFAAECGASGLAVSSVTVGSVTPMGKLNKYHLIAKVTNVSGASQPSSALQFVDIYQGTEKLDAKSVPPLGAGQSYMVAYDSLRSPEAGNGTTTLTFALDTTRPISAMPQSCIAASGNTVTF
ncbi:MAG TPA: hypothetical protein VKR05_07240 [Candidatus Cybelea sp.]|nr:hypothetical protein [Candidatus Cybelea sp.]